MSAASSTTYRVTIRHNVVVAIDVVAVAGAAKPEDDPLAISSLLAANHRQNGCLDGEYRLSDAEAARYFAHLSLDFTKCLVEKAIESLEARSIAGTGWTNPYVPR
jgi:hypothetical protein